MLIIKEDIMEDIYIDLLLTKCIDINTSKILFIN